MLHKSGIGNSVAAHRATANQRQEKVVRFLFVNTATERIKAGETRDVLINVKKYLLTVARERFKLIF